MKKALLTSTAVLALGMFGFGVNQASAAPSISLHNIPVAVATGGSSATSLNKSLDGNSVGSDNVKGSLDGNNVPITTASKGGAAAAEGSTAIQGSSIGNDNGNIVPIDLLGAQATNGSLANMNSFNTHVTVTLASAVNSAHFGGKVINNNQNGSLDGGISVTAGLGVGAGGTSNVHHSGCFFCGAGAVGGDGLGVGVGGTAQGGNGAYPGFYGNGSTANNTVSGSIGVISATSIAGNGMAQVNNTVAIGAVDSGATIDPGR